MQNTAFAAISQRIQGKQRGSRKCSTSCRKMECRTSGPPAADAICNAGSRFRPSAPLTQSLLFIQPALEHSRRRSCKKRERSMVVLVAQSKFT